MITTCALHCRVLMTGRPWRCFKSAPAAKCAANVHARASMKGPPCSSLQLALWLNFVCTDPLPTQLSHCRLPVKYKLRLKRMLVMYAHAMLRSVITCVCPFFSHSFWSKLHFVQSLEDLWSFADEVRPGCCTVLCIDHQPCHTQCLCQDGPVLPILQGKLAHQLSPALVQSKAAVGDAEMALTDIGQVQPSAGSSVDASSSRYKASDVSTLRYEA